MRHKIQCGCGKEYPRHSRSVHASSINGIANGCIECKPEVYQRRMIQAQTLCRHRLAKHIAARRERTIYRDVVYRYLQRFGGQTFTVRTAIDDADIYLEDVNGRILGSVSYSDKYPKLPAAETFDGMLF